MRAAVLEALYTEAHRDSRVFLVNPDSIGFHCEAYRREMPGQYLNVGIAEQNAVGVAAGLALTGRRPFIFNILAFNSFRCYEQVRLDICAMNLSVVLVGIGAGLDYGMFGPSHHTMEDVALMRSLPGMSVWSPADDKVAAALVGHCVSVGGPAYLRLHRSDGSAMYPDGIPDVAGGIEVVRPGKDILIAATGPMVRRGLEVAEALAVRGVDAAVVDVFRLKPLPEQRLLELVRSCGRVVTMEEHLASGGLGSALLELLSERGVARPVQRFGLPDRFCFACGDRQYLHAVNGLDTATLAARIME